VQLVVMGGQRGPGRGKGNVLGWVYWGGGSGGGWGGGGGGGGGGGEQL